MTDLSSLMRFSLRVGWFAFNGGSALAATPRAAMAATVMISGRFNQTTKTVRHRSQRLLQLLLR